MNKTTVQTKKTDYYQRLNRCNWQARNGTAKINVEGGVPFYHPNLCFVFRTIHTQTRAQSPVFTRVWTNKTLRQRAWWNVWIFLMSLGNVRKPIAMSRCWGAAQVYERFSIKNDRTFQRLVRKQVIYSSMFDGFSPLADVRFRSHIAIEETSHPSFCGFRCPDTA